MAIIEFSTPIRTTFQHHESTINQQNMIQTEEKSAENYPISELFDGTKHLKDV